MKKQLLIAIITSIFITLSGCSSQPPKETHKDVCQLFNYNKDWYLAASQAEKHWGVPKEILLAFVHQESRFKNDAQPKRPYLFGIIPLPRRSSAYGYAQAKDAVWGEYKKATGSLFASRDNIYDAMDFIGWYNHLSHKKLGISKKDTKRLYLAYHEGRGGYQRKTYLKKPWLLKVADKVARQAQIYRQQIKRCSSSYQCNAPWPFCR